MIVTNSSFYNSEHHKKERKSAFASLSKDYLQNNQPGFTLILGSKWNIPVEIEIEWEYWEITFPAPWKSMINLLNLTLQEWQKSLMD